MNYSLSENITGLAPKAPTNLSLNKTEKGVTFNFECLNANPTNPYTQNNAPLWQSNVVEIFLKTTAGNKYFEIEVSPLGNTFCAEIENINGKFSAEFMPIDFTYSVNKSVHSYSVSITLPLKESQLKNVEFNAFRVDEKNGELELQALFPTISETFHKPSFFKKLSDYVK